MRITRLKLAEGPILENICQNTSPLGLQLSDEHRTHCNLIPHIQIQTKSNVDSLKAEYLQNDPTQPVKLYLLSGFVKFHPKTPFV